MKRPNRYLVVILALAAAGLVWYMASPREPAFEDRKLSEWLGDLVELDSQSRGPEEGGPVREAWEARHERATSAVRSIGSNALPHLVRWVRTAPGPSPLRDKAEELLSQQSWVRIHIPERRDRSGLAGLGFIVLGSNAVPAMPELSRLLVQPGHAQAAAECLQAIGPPAFPWLARGLTNANPNVRHLALVKLLEVGTQLGPPVLPAVIHAITNDVAPLYEWEIRLLGDSGPLIRALAPWLDAVANSPTNALAGTALRLITVASDQPQKYLPLFSERLDTAAYAPDAAFALSRMGPSGLPPLLRALTNEDVRIRGAALAAMQPELRTALPGYWFSTLIGRFDSQCRVWSTASGPFAGRRELQALVISSRLARLLDYPDAAARVQIVQLLERCGVYAAAGLSRAAEDGDERVRSAARAALERLDLEVKDGAIVRGPRAGKQIALVFTGHQYAESGQTILDELERHKAQASFFLTGEFLTEPGFRPLVQRICQEGHLLGAHSGKHLLYCSWEEPKAALLTHDQFVADFSFNLTGIAGWLQSSELPGYFVPPYQHCNFQVVGWAGEYSYITINPTSGTSSAADYTDEAEQNFASSQAIFDSIIARERQDPNGLNGFILLFHLGAGPGRTDKFHARFGQLLDQLAAKGYQFVAMDTLLDPQLAERNRWGRVVMVHSPLASEASEAFKRRYGLSR